MPGLIPDATGVSTIFLGACNKPDTPTSVLVASAKSSKSIVVPLKSSDLL